MAGMPFFAKHWLQRLCLGGAGVLISAFGPEQVPGTYKPLLFWFGIALAVLAVLIWPMLERASTILRRRRMQSSDLPIVVEPAPKPHRMASVEDIRDIVSGLTFDIARKRTEDLPPDVAAILEAKRRSALEAALRPKFDMTFNALVRRVAYESQWAADFKAETPGTQWQQSFWWEPLKKEIFRALTSGDLQARGILNRYGDVPDTGPTPIPTDFWRKADFYPELMLTDSAIGDAVNGDRKEIYTDIEVQSRDVDNLWPSRTDKAMHEQPSPFVAWFKKWREEQDEAFLNDRLRREEAASRTPWHEGRTRLTIREAGCLAAGVSPRDFENSDEAQSKASELRYYVEKGYIPIAGTSPADQQFRKVSRDLSIDVPSVSLDTYVTKRDLETFQDESGKMWLEVIDDLAAKHRK